MSLSMINYKSLSDLAVKLIIDKDSENEVAKKVALKGRFNQIC